MLVLRQAWREVRAERRFFLLFLFNLALGLSGLLTAEGFRRSLQDELRANAQNLLGADLALSARRTFNQTERELVDELGRTAAARSSLVETFSMVRTPRASRLTLLRAIGPNYPLRGYLDLSQGGRLGEGSASAALAGDRAWMDADLARTLGLAPGATFRLGDVTFTLSDFLEEDPTQGLRGLAQAGRIVLSLESLRRTGLLRPESTATYTELLRFPPGADLKATARAWAKRFRDPGVQVRAAGDAADESGRLLAYLGDFLGLSSLVALFLASLGSAYLFRTWLVRRARTFALHRTLGLSFARAAVIPGAAVLGLALAAVPLALLLARVELAGLSALVQSLAPVTLKPRLGLAPTLLGFAVASGGSLLLALPFLASLRQLPPRELLGGKIPEPRLGPTGLALLAPAALFLYGLAVYACRSFRTAALFGGGLLAALLVAGIAGGGLLFLAERLARAVPRAPWPVRQGLLHLSRRGASSLAGFVALALAALLLNFLPQLRASLGAELAHPGAARLPSFFLFDIQEEQLTPLARALAEMGHVLESVSPLVRARLVAVNGRNFERAAEGGDYQTREEEMEARFRNRGFNLSYRAGLLPSETLVAGRPFTAGGGPELSVEDRFAERLGLRLNDRLRFDVQGVEVEGTVVNLRRVRWTTFRPNFFVIFNEGELEGAPKIYLGALPDLPPAEREAVQDLVAARFPNVSVIDVRATVGRALELADRLRWCLNLMSLVALLAGLVVLFSIAYRQAELRRGDLNLCRILGARATSLRAQLLWEFGLLGATASLIGALGSLAFSWGAARYFFDGAFSPEIAPLALSVGLCTGLSLLVATLGARGAWARDPAELLREEPPQ